MNIQEYAEQAAYQVMEKKGARQVSILVMNPKNGEILAMASVPGFHLNDPFSLPEGENVPADEKEKQDLLNQIWRNPCVSDTYEPGSTSRSSPPPPGWRRGWWIWTTISTARDSALWRTGNPLPQDGRPRGRDIS